MQHGHGVGNRARGRHVVGDGHCGGPHFDDNLADQIVDDAGHDRVQPGGGFVEKDDFRLCGNGAGQTHAFLHAARQLGGQAVGHVGFEAHAAQFLDGDGAGLFARAFEGAAQQAKGDVLPDRQAVEQRAALKQHAEAGQKGIAVAGTCGLAIDQNGACIRCHQPQNAFQRHGFSGAGATDDHHRCALGDMQVDPAQHVVGAERFGNALHPDHSEKNTPVSTKFAARISTAAASTEPLVAAPTPMAPRPEFMP